MAYKKPGAYARFVRTAGAVNSPGATRVMALVGTGSMFFDTKNESVVRKAGSSIDELAIDNILEIYNVTSRPMKDLSVAVSLTNGGEAYVSGVDFELKEGKYIAWKADESVVDGSVDAKVNVLDGTGSGVGAGEFKAAVTPTIIADKAYLVKDAKYRIQITYVDKDMFDDETGAGNHLYGTYMVVDAKTEEILGEYTVGANKVEAIPGVELVVTDTNVDGAKEGDYVIIETKALTPKKKPADNAVYYVSYQYKKPESDFEPKVFTDYADVVAEYGNYDVLASGKVINSLALGAEIAFINGVQPLVLVQAKNDSDYEIKKAIDKLEKGVPGITNVNTIVPLSTSTGVASHVMNHVTNMSSEAVGKERMTYLATRDGETPTNIAANAAGFNNERVVYITPGSAVKEVKDIDTGRISLRKVPGCYLAIAVAAIGLKNDPAEPLTNKNITGFASLGEFYSEAEKNLMAEKGVLVLEQHGFNMRVRHGITTSVAEVNSAEITLVQIKDYVIEAARTNLGDLYVGRKLMPTILGDVQTTLTNILAQFVAQEIIIGFGGVSVKRSAEDPRAIDVSFEIEAVYPLNYINISFSFSGVN